MITEILVLSFSALLIWRAIDIGRDLNTRVRRYSTEWFYQLFLIVAALAITALYYKHN